MTTAEDGTVLLEVSAAEDGAARSWVLRLHLRPGQRVAPAALESLRGVGASEAGGGDADAGADADAPSSIVFDWLGESLSPDQKRALAPSLEKAAQVGVQSILWNAVILAAIFLTLINFAGGR